MTVKEALTHYPQDETELFLSHLLKWEKSKLYTDSDKKLTHTQEQKLKRFILQLRKGVPLAYILGYKYFYGLCFTVTKDTLIPRPETEWIIDKTLELVKSFPNASILDIGTGSGCIAVSLAKHSQAKVYAIDVSEKALQVAKLNAKKLNAKVSFEKANLLPKQAEQFDIIIANLPYVPKEFYENNLANLKHEPKFALIDKKSDGALYVELFKKISKLKKQPKYLLLEIDPSQVLIIKQQIKQLFPKAKIQFQKDLHKLYRFAVIDFAAV